MKEITFNNLTYILLTKDDVDLLESLSEQGVVNITCSVLLSKTPMQVGTYLAYEISSAKLKKTEN